MTPEQRRLVELNYDRFVRAGAKLSPEEKAKVGKINEELAGLFTDFGNKVLADENTWIVLESKKDLAGLSPSLVATYKAAADEREARRQVGSRQHAVERRSVPRRVVAPRPAREGVEGVQEPRRQRRRQRHQRDHRPHREAARRAREAPRLPDARALAHGRHDGHRPREGEGADDAGLARGGRARRRGSRRHGEDREARRRQAAVRAVGLPLLRREGPQGEVRPRPGRAQAVLRAQQHDRRHRSTWPSSSTASRSPRSPARCRSSSRRPRLGGQGQGDRRLRRPLLRRLLRAPGQALRRVGLGLPRARDVHRQDHHADHLEQQQLRQGRAPASRC